MEILENHSLESWNTFRFPCHAEFFACADEIADLQELLAWARQRAVAVTILGGGSNVVLQERLPGLVIANQIDGVQPLTCDPAQPRVLVGAGVNWHQLVLHTLAQGWNGLENLSLIPGSAGAAPIQNIGAYGVELAQSFVELEACAVASGELLRFSRSDCKFGYRDSIFKNECRDAFVITAVTLELRTDGKVHTAYGELNRVLEASDVYEPTPSQVSDAVIQVRSAKLPDPAVIGNAGSFFKNPVIPAADLLRVRECAPDVIAHKQADGQYKLAAGWLIDQCGWKGYRHDGVGVHDRQALVLVHEGGATARNLLALADEIREDVVNRFGVSLEMEPRIYGKSAV